MAQAEHHSNGAGAKALRTALATLIALSSMLAILAGTCADEAHAAESVTLDIGNKISYAGYTTTWMYADGEMAYCGNPSANTPPAGTYSKSPISAISGRNAETVADLWFGYGSPGFERDLWPSTWYDGSAMTDARYAALAHILLSDTFSSNGNYALFGCNESFKSWCRYNVIGFGADGSLINDNATGRRILARMGEVPKNFEAFMLHTGSGNQLILSFKFIPYGKISLTKTSGIESISQDNSCYSLEGAVYDVYTDANLTGKAGSITTDANGQGELGELIPGTYYVKESKASKGYALDPSLYTVEVYSDTTTPVGGSKGSMEIPKSDPVGMLVMKADATTGKGAPQGAGTLSGAEFTVSFYAGLYDSALAAEGSGAPARTWVFRTDSDGFAYYDDSYKVAGPALYHMSNGDATLPLGTAVIQETKAPTGYNLDDGNGGAPKKFCVQITDDGAIGEAVYTYNTPKVPDTVKRGDYRLVKEVPIEVESPSGIVQESERVLLSGITFEIINSSESAVVSPQTGREVEPGDVVCSITTDENGLASTRNGLSANGWDIPQGWTGALAYGTYTVHEVIPASVAGEFKAKYGHTLIAVPDWKMTISSEGQYDQPILVNNHIPQTPLKVMKLDAETGLQIPLACSFQLLDSEGELVTYEAHYPDTHVLDTWTTNEKGEVMLPMLLEEGDYTLVEVQAPEGYVKAAEGKSVHISDVYNDWDCPVIVEFEDMPQKATISVEKHDGSTGEPVDDSVYIVKAAADVVTPDGTTRAHEGEIMATLTTDVDGRATTPELYLGTYTVYEAKAKDGYALDVAEKTVTLDYAGQDVAVYDHEEEVTDYPTDPKIKKVDALDPEKTIAGAVFHIWNDEGTFDEEMTTDADGVISLAYAKHGTYHIQEVSAPDGYAITDLDEEGNPAVTDFKVNDQGMIEWDETGAMAQSHTFELENMPKAMHTTATDADSGTHEGQARDELTVVDTIEYTGLIPGKEYTATGVLMDKATGEPATDDEGDQITASTTFTAEESCGTVDVTFTFPGVTLAGKSLVAFETIEHEGTEYMVHADIEDVDQTVSIVDIATQARDGITDTSTGTVTEEGKLIDSVSYTGLTPGNEYRIFTTLMDKETGNALTGDDGLPKVGTTSFTPESASGTIDIAVELDTTELAGKSVVFFERLTDEPENIIAVHEDIEDEGQTVTFPEEAPEPETPGKGYPKTGGFADVNPVVASIVVIVLCGCAGAGYACIRRIRKTAEAPDALEEEAHNSIDESQA